MSDKENAFKNCYECGSKIENGDDFHMMHNGELSCIPCWKKTVKDILELKK